ncbi:hypothetical protein BdWA1_001579 [Babesia duncani]|uniref:Uncharacterized protein n=1 Tax=Babesia duncani TaxID=323732 RepID=A0AAD9PK67_9APIC|nr:hypothetical protein BdWA1_001579 [Babesia duncani]
MLVDITKAVKQGDVNVTIIKRKNSLEYIYWMEDETLGFCSIFDGDKTLSSKPIMDKKIHVLHIGSDIRYVKYTIKSENTVIYKKYFNNHWRAITSAIFVAKWVRHTKEMVFWNITIITEALERFPIDDEHFVYYPSPNVFVSKIYHLGTVLWSFYNDRQRIFISSKVNKTLDELEINFENLKNKNLEQVTYTYTDGRWVETRYNGGIEAKDHLNSINHLYNGLCITLEGLRTATRQANTAINSFNTNDTNIISMDVNNMASNNYKNFKIYIEEDHTMIIAQGTHVFGDIWNDGVSISNKEAICPFIIYWINKNKQKCIYTLGVLGGEHTLMKYVAINKGRWIRARVINMEKPLIQFVLDITRDADSRFYSMDTNNIDHLRTFKYEPQKFMGIGSIVEGTTKIYEFSKTFCGPIYVLDTPFFKSVSFEHVVGGKSTYLYIRKFEDGIWRPTNVFGDPLFG